MWEASSWPPFFTGLIVGSLEVPLILIVGGLLGKLYCRKCYNNNNDKMMTSTIFEKKNVQVKDENLVLDLNVSEISCILVLFRTKAVS